MSKPCMWNGIYYSSIKDAAEANYISIPGMWDRIKKGYTCDDDLYKKWGKPCVWNGIHYDSIKAAALANEVTPGGMGWRLRHGYICDDDLK